MRCVAIIGCASNWEDDLNNLRALVDDFDVIAVGLDCPYTGHVHYFATYHVKDIQVYRKKRWAAALNVNFKVISHVNKPELNISLVIPYKKPSGSSSLLAAFAAVFLKYDKVVLCGCPLEGVNAKKFSYKGFRKGWTTYVSLLNGCVRSMSGWTKEFLGEPTKEWLGMELTELLSLFHNKKGLEVGGPSRVFMEGAQFPVYPVVANLDGCNFAKQTLWENGLEEGLTYNYYADKKGFQFICEATALTPKINEHAYDFVISSNCLEHSANPLKAVEEMKKVLKIGGILFLILPKKEANFDHNRQVVPYRHLYDDYKANRGEDDLSHLEEIVALHDLAMDPPAGDKEQFRARSLKNFENRGLHQHVFDMKLLKNILWAFNIKEIFALDTGGEYFIAGRK